VQGGEVMRRAAIALGVALAAAAAAPPPVDADPKPAAAPAKPAASGPLRAYRGPEGEIIVMVEANDGKDMLVHFKSLGQELDGKTVLYRIEDLGHGDKNVYVEKKRGSKTVRSNLLSCRDGGWEFYYPGKADVQFQIYYSRHASEQFKLEDVLNAYKP
jgi:hypothetical protein